MECFKNSQAIRPPYVVMPKYGDTAYTHVGWDINCDGSVNNKDVVDLFKYVSGGDIELSDKPYDPNAKVILYPAKFKHPT